MLGVQNIGSVSVVKARSALSGECLSLCRQAFDDCLNNRRAFLVLDLQECPLIDSEGLEFIVDSQQSCLGRGGRMAIAEPQPLCEEILEITGVKEYVAVFSELRAALGDFAR